MRGGAAAGGPASHLPLRKRRADGSANARPEKPFNESKRLAINVTERESFDKAERIAHAESKRRELLRRHARRD